MSKIYELIYENQFAWLTQYGVITKLSFIYGEKTVPATIEDCIRLYEIWTEDKETYHDFK